MMKIRSINNNTFYHQNTQYYVGLTAAVSAKWFTWAASWEFQNSPLRSNKSPIYEWVLFWECILFFFFLLHPSGFSFIFFNILFYFSFSFIFISWRLITLQYCSGFCHTLTWISHGFTCVPRPDPISHLPLHPIPLGLPSAPGLSTCLMHPTWTGDLFHPR